MQSSVPGWISALYMISGLVAIGGLSLLPYAGMAFFLYLLGQMVTL